MVGAWVILFVACAPPRVQSGLAVNPRAASRVRGAIHLYRLPVAFSRLYGMKSTHPMRPQAVRVGAVGGPGGAPPETGEGTEVQFFTSRHCAYAQRSWIALNEKEIVFEAVEIDLDEKPEWYAMYINPVGKVESTHKR
eukprot:1392460-Amorphochlora_amoeboformis.AAC.1